MQRQCAMSNHRLSYSTPHSIGTTTRRFASRSPYRASITYSPSDTFARSPLHASPDEKPVTHLAMGLIR